MFILPYIDNPLLRQKYNFIFSCCFPAYNIILSNWRRNIKRQRNKNKNDQWCHRPEIVIINNLVMFLFFFFFLAALQHMEFLAKGSDLSLSCSKAGSFNPLCWGPARDWTCVLALQRCCWSWLATVGTPMMFILGIHTHHAYTFKYKLRYYFMSNSVTLFFHLTYHEHGLQK